MIHKRKVRSGSSCKKSSAADDNCATATSLWTSLLLLLFFEYSSELVEVKSCAHLGSDFASSELEGACNPNFPRLKWSVRKLEPTGEWWIVGVTILLSLCWCACIFRTVCSSLGDRVSSTGKQWLCSLTSWRNCWTDHWRESERSCCSSSSDNAKGCHNDTITIHISTAI